MKNQRVARSAFLPCLAALIPTVVVGVAALAVSAPGGAPTRPARAIHALAAQVRAALAPAPAADVQLADYAGGDSASLLKLPGSVFQVRKRIVLPRAGSNNVPLALVPFGTGDVIRITNAGGQTVRAPQSATDTSIAPNQPLTFTVQLNNNNANAAANVQAVYLQFKDPDSKYQDVNFALGPQEHKVFTKDSADFFNNPTDSGSATFELYNGQTGENYQPFTSKEGSFIELQRGAIGGHDSTSDIAVGRVDNVNTTITQGPSAGMTVNFQQTSNPIQVTDGNNTHSLDDLAIDNYNYPTDAENAFHAWGQEYECQYLNANPNNNTAGYTGTNQDASAADYGTPYYLAGFDDQYVHAFPGARPEWLALLPVMGQTNQYQATWSPPYSPSDYYVDVIVSYKAASDNSSHWRIFDNTWGFSTLPFDPTPSNSHDILVVSDNALGQKSGASAPTTAGLVNLRPSFYGAESYFTDYDLSLLPNTTEYWAPPPSGRKPHVDSGMTQVNLDDQRPIEFIQPLGFGFFRGGEGQVLNGLGVGSYGSYSGFNSNTDPVLFHDPTVTVNGQSVPRSQAYSIWRNLSRGRVPQSVYQAFEPTFQAQPAVNDPITGFKAPAADGSTGNAPEVTAAPRCIVWVSPFAGDEPLNISGSIVDPAVQGDLRAFVNAGGRLMVSGQEIVSAITLNGQANNGAGSFVSDVLNATLKTIGNNSANNQTLTAVTGRGNQITYDSLLNEGGGTGTNGDNSDFFEYDASGGGFYQPPGNTSPFLLGDNLNENDNGNRRTDGALTQLGPTAVQIGTAVIQGQINSINAQNGAKLQISNSDGPCLVYRSNYTASPAGQPIGNGYGSRVVFASFGLEGLGIEYYRKTNGHDFFFPRNDRPNILHNAVSYLQTGTFQGTIFQGTGTNTVVPGATVYLTTSAGTTLPGPRQVYSAITDGTGNYLIKGVEPGTYKVTVYKNGFTESSTLSFDPNGQRYTVEGDTSATINLNITPLPPGVINGTVMVSNGTGVQSPAPIGTPVTFVSTTGGPTASGVTIDSSGDYSVTAPVGTYNGTASTTNPPATQTINGIAVPQNNDGTAGSVTVNFLLTVNPSHISGGVYLNGQALGGATVSFAPVPASAGTVQSTTSNTTAPVGGYTSPGLAAGTYSVTATAAVGGVFYVGQAATNVTVAAAAAQGGVDINLQPAQTATLTGTVRDNTTLHAPINGVTITTVGPAGTLTATTGLNGMYTLSLPQGTYIVTASKTGYGSVSQSVSIPIGMTTASADFTLTALTNLTAGYAAGHYNMVSYPNEYAPLGGGNAFTDIFGSLINAVNPNGNRGPAFIYDSGGLFQPLRQHYAVEPTIPADALHLGRGYFVYIQTVKPQFTLLGTPPAGSTVSVALQGGNGLDGWNMIGVPSATPISVSNLHFQIGSVTAKYSDAVAAGYIYPTVYAYSPGSNSYVAVTQMQPFQGYWIRAKISGLTILIPTGGG